MAADLCHHPSFKGENAPVEPTFKSLNASFNTALQYLPSPHSARKSFQTWGKKKWETERQDTSLHWHTDSESDTDTGVV